MPAFTQKPRMMPSARSHLKVAGHRGPASPLADSRCHAYVEHHSGDSADDDHTVANWDLVEDEGTMGAMATNMVLASCDWLLSLGSGHSVHDALDIVFDDGVAEDVMASWVEETAADASARSPSSTPSSPRFRTQQAAQASAASTSSRAQKQGQHGVNGLQVIRSPHTGTTFTLGSQQKAGPWGGFW